jgi:LPXTG-site transpeptidase (sortase) family protein
VFQRLKDLRPGDEVSFYSKEGRRLFRVTETKVVRNTDTSVLAHKAGQALVTLITCEGRWVPADNDYDQRRIVHAEPVA